MCQSYCRLIHLKWPSPCLWATWLKYRLDWGRISEWRRICSRDLGAVTVFGDLLPRRVYRSLTWGNFVRSSKSKARWHNPHMDWELRKKPIFRIPASAIRWSMLRNSPRSCWIWGNGQTRILPQCWHFCIQLLVAMSLKWSRGGTRSRILDCSLSFRLSSHRWCSIASHRSGCWRDCYLRMQTISLQWLPRKHDMGIPTQFAISFQSKLTLSRVSGYSYAG